MALDPASGVYGGYVPASNARTPTTQPKKKKAPKAVRRTVSAPRSYSSGGGGSTYSAPRSVPQNNPGKVEPVQKPMSLTDWLKKDSEYQNQLRQFGKTWNDFLADVSVRKGRAGQDLMTGKDQMATQRTRDLGTMKDDFAGRGMLQSSAYGDTLGKYETDYQTNLMNLTNQNARILQDIATEQSNFKRSQDQAKEQAKQDAARRRAAGGN
jgi:hypothetical protein